MAKVDEIGRWIGVLAQEVDEAQSSIERLRIKMFFIKADAAEVGEALSETEDGGPSSKVGEKLNVLVEEAEDMYAVMDELSDRASCARTDAIDMSMAYYDMVRQQRDRTSRCDRGQCDREERGNQEVP